jgi:hypothetical protein
MSSNAKTKEVKETLQLPHVFTRAEREEHYADMADGYAEKQSQEAALKTATSQIKGQIAAQEQRISLAAGLIRDGHEIRATECRKTYDWLDGTVHTVRLDTCETVELRQMTTEERQLELHYAQKAEAEAAKLVPIDGGVSETDERGVPAMTDEEMEEASARERAEADGEQPDADAE